MYGLWLFKELRTEYGHCKVEVFRKGYTASAVEIGGFVGNSLNLALENLDTITAPIGKSVCSFSIYDTDQVEYDDLFTPDATAYKVVVSTKVDGGAYVTRWSGYITPDFFAENLSYRTPISISARDNIGYLNDVDFDLDIATITVRELIQAAFNRIAEDYPMSLSFVTQKQTEEGVLAIDATISTYLLREMSWYEALETILHDLGLQMRWVDNNTIAVLDISQLGENFGLQRFNFVERSGYREILPAWRELSQKQDYGLRENFFEGWMRSNNLTFAKEIIIRPPNATMWTSSIACYIPNNYGVARNAFTTNPEYYGGSFGKKLYFSGVDKDNPYTSFLSWRQVVQPSNKPMKFQFKAFNSVIYPGEKYSNSTTPSGRKLEAYNPVKWGAFSEQQGDFVQIGLRINLLLHSGLDTYVLRNQWIRVENGEDTANSINFVLPKVELSYIEGNDMSGTEPSEQDVTVDIATIPYAGELELRIYGYYIVNKHNYWEDDWDLNDYNFDWEKCLCYINEPIYTFNNEDAQTGQDSKVQIAELHNIKEDRDYSFGQVPLDCGGINAYAGGLFKANGDELVGFKRNVDGSTYPLLELVGREIIHFNKRNYNKLSGTIKNLAKEPLRFDRMFIYKGKNYLPFACSLDVISNTMNITTMQEVEPYMTQSFVEIKSELVTGGGATISGGNNTALQYSAEVGNAKRISELNNASESEKKESYIVIDNAAWNESKKVPLSEMEGLDEVQVEAYLTEKKYAKQSWVKGITDDLETDIAKRVLIEDFEKLQEAVDLNYANLNKATARVSTLEGYFSNGVANNAAKLGGQLPAYYATAAALGTTNTNLSNLSTTVGTIGGSLSTLTGRVDAAEGTIKEHTSSISEAVADIAANTKAITAIDNRVYVLEALGFVLKDGYIYTEKTIVSKGEIISGRRASGTSTDVGGGGGISSVTAQMIADALGYVPYSSANPAGYINSSALNGYAKLTDIPSLSGYATQVWVEGKKYLTAHQDISHLLSKTDAANTYQPKGNYLTSVSWSDVSGKPTFAAIATSGKYSDLSGVPTSLPASDVYAWAKAATKPTYTASEVGALSTSGGTITGSYDALKIKRNNAYASLIKFENTSGAMGYLGFNSANIPVMYTADANTPYTLLHENNIGSYAFIPRADNLISNVDADHYWVNGVYLNQTGNGSGNSNFPNNYAMFLSFNNGASNYVTQFDMGRGAAYYRTKIDSWGEWNEFITSANIGSQSVSYASKAGNADTLDTLHSIDFVRSFVDVGANNYKGNALGYTYSTEAHGGAYAGGFISFGNGIYGCQINGSFEGSRLAFRGLNNGVFSSWKTVAFTDSNVASATKLQTARTIWGQSFDGTNNISGVPLYLYNEGNHYSYIVGETKGMSLQSFINGVGYLPIMLNPNGGNVLIGTASDSGGKLQVSGNIKFLGGVDREIGTAYSTTDTNTYNRIIIGCDSTGIKYCSGKWTSGNVMSHNFCVGMSDTTAMAIMNNGNVEMHGNLTAAGEVISSRRASSSDRRLKNNITYLDTADCLAMIRQIRPAEWDWKDNGKHSMGFIAQDVEHLMPYAVTSIKDDELGYKLNLQYDQFIALAIGGVQAVDSKVEKLEIEVKELREKLAKYETQWQ